MHVTTVDVHDRVYIHASVCMHAMSVLLCIRLCPQACWQAASQALS